MITLIINSYMTILLSVGVGALALFVLGLYFIFSTVGAAPKPAVKQPNKAAKPDIIPPPAELHDVSAIAGEDVLTTQLDLARAFIETGKKAPARTILQMVARQGNAAQQQEAQRLSQSL